MCDHNQYICVYKVTKYYYERKRKKKTNIIDEPRTVFLTHNILQMTKQQVSEEERKISSVYRRYNIVE